jgi:uridine kinase
MPPDATYLAGFGLKKFEKGFIMSFPAPFHIGNRAYEEQPKLARVFADAERWASILEVSKVADLNELVKNKGLREFIMVNETLHEKKLSELANNICEREKARVILIAGLSSSGKTTFAHRLSIQLRVNGLKPVTISLDDYFVNREDTPRDEKGDYDFEALEAIDIKLFNRHLRELIAGREVEIPIFNFTTGCREPVGRKLQIGEDGILVIEGIHGLNERLTPEIPRSSKFKIYVSALTSMNIDDHNRIPTTDVRILRRIVRDNMSRGKNAEATILSWPSVRAGEDKNIFPFQEEADTMFNSTLTYEMSILKKYAEPLLKEITKSSPIYIEAKRLLIFLSYFLECGEDMIPNNSIIREFIGGSCFYK